MRESSFFWAIALAACCGSPDLSMAQQGQYYVIFRYQCVDTSSGNDRGSCDISTASNNSCQEATQAQQSQLSNAGGDPCRVCANIVDDSRRWNGNAPEHIQGGPCQGM
jgi:hypothetical protein